MLKALQPLRGWHRLLHARASGVLLSLTVTRAIQDILVSSLRTFHFGWRGAHAGQVRDFQAVARDVSVPTLLWLLCDAYIALFRSISICFSVFI